MVLNVGLLRTNYARGYDRSAFARVAESVDARDLKSRIRKGVRVRVPSRAPIHSAGTDCALQVPAGAVHPPPPACPSSWSSRCPGRSHRPGAAWPGVRRRQTQHQHQILVAMAFSTITRRWCSRSPRPPGRAPAPGRHVGAGCRHGRRLGRHLGHATDAPAPGRSPPTRSGRHPAVPPRRRAATPARVAGLVGECACAVARVCGACAWCMPSFRVAA